MTVFRSIFQRPISRRRLLTAGVCGAAGLALYSGEIARHWIEVVHRDIALAGLSQVFDGLRIVQLSDIHMDGFTEPFFLRHAVELINSMQPDQVYLTGDFASDGISTKAFAVGAAWQCANILNTLQCANRFAVMGNHDVGVGEQDVTAALTANGITVLNNAYLPIERTGGRFWLAGVADPLWGQPDPELAIPPSIRHVPHEPVILLSHAPDYADTLLRHPAGAAIDLMLSGHTHGGQVRLPLVGALELPELGRKYVEGWFRLGGMQLYVNRGIGTVGVPFRLNCPPEITLFTLRAA